VDRIHLDGIPGRPADDFDDTGQTQPDRWPQEIWATRYAAAAAIAGVIDGNQAARTELLTEPLTTATALRWMIQHAVDPTALRIAPLAPLLPNDLWRRVGLPKGVPADAQAHLRTVYFNAHLASGTAPKILRAAALLHGIPIRSL
jgi:hypothetical protein